ncbi:thioredoxin fold domain-containing protein [Thalassomonas sp. RHCl1]|uniref:TlpA family protein disulfide reductase n=1 Tax=Thalassomonas sp. RHCl1 TaxID=2995320 RepID=UPI00248C98DC|nr:thioredoxin fold domain-containing protein [Thalassomonas sp. RHCl1]
MMKSNILNWLKIIVLISVSAIIASARVQALPFTLKSLKPAQESVMLENNGLATVAMIYQPDCPWCKKQGKALAKAFKHCQSSVNTALVGTRGNDRQLKKELKHYHKDMPAYAADRQFLRKIGGYQASPTTLIFDGKGELVAKKRGFIPTDKLANALLVLSQGACRI